MNFFKRLRRKSSRNEEGTVPAAEPVAVEEVFDAAEVLVDLAAREDVGEVLKVLDVHLEQFQQQGHGPAVGRLAVWAERQLQQEGIPSPDRLAQLGSLYQRLETEAREEYCRRALGLYQRALEGFRAAGEQEGEAVILNNMGLAYAELGLTDPECFCLAIPLLEEALQFYEDGEELSCRAAICLALGEAYLGLEEAGFDHLELARDFFERSWALAERCGIPLDQAAAQGKLGDVQVKLAEFYGQETFVKAIRHYRNALSIYVEHQELESCGFYQARLGAAYVALSNMEEEHLRKGMRAYQRALEMFRQSGNPRSVASTCMELGALHRTLGQNGDREHLEAALETYLEALGIYQELGMDSERGAALQRLARIYLDAGAHSESEDIEQAVLLLEEAASIYTRNKQTVEFRAVHDQLLQARGWLANRPSA